MKNKVTHDGKDGLVFHNPMDYIKEEDRKNLYREQAKRIIQKQKKKKKENG